MKVIDNKNVNITEEEWQYYLELVKLFSNNQTNGALYFNNLFTTDAIGNIILIKPQHAIPQAILFFVQNLMINQRLVEFDKMNAKIKELEDEIKELHNKRGKK